MLTSHQQGMRGVVLSRVSTDKQEKGTSLREQDATSCTYAEELGIPIVAQFRDAETGREVSRAGLEAALKMLSSGEANCLFVYDETRFSRRTSDGLRLCDDLMEDGVRLFFSKYRLEYTGSPSDRFRFGIGFLYGEMEWSYIKDRMDKGRLRKIKGDEEATARPYGAGDPPYGYRWEGYGKQRTLEIDPDRAPWVVRIFEWYDQGMPVRDIRQKLTDLRAPMPTKAIVGGRERVMRRNSGEWSPPTIYKILRRMAYIGQFEHNKFKSTKIKGTKKYKTTYRPEEERILAPCPAIITDIELWDRVQQRLTDGRKNAPRNLKWEYLMAKHLRCGVCKCMYSGLKGSQTEKDRKEGRMRKTDENGYYTRMYYRCLGTDKHNSVQGCDMPFIKYWQIDEAIWNWIATRLTNRAWVERMLKAERAENTDKQADLRRELDWLTKEISDTTDTIRNLGLMSAQRPTLAHIFDKDIDDQEQKLLRLERDLKEKQELIAVQLTDEQIEDIATVCGSLGESIDAGWTFDEKRDLVEVIKMEAKVMRSPLGEIYLDVTSRFKFRDVVKLFDPSVQTVSTLAARLI